MKKVFVGISGGVDSSVAAYLLKEQGYDVTGVFIKAWYPEFLDCNWRKEMQDAMRVCAKLNIPFLLCDSEKEYKEGVVDYMIKEYKEGRTPNPDVMCNKYVKFDSFFNFAMNNGADYVATGHYARVNDTSPFNLLKAVDREKDQSYFLWTLPQNVLSKTLFPIGGLLKTEVRDIAQKAGLLTANKKDSQGLCFLGHVDMKDFLRKYVDVQPGDVLNQSGEIIGKHDGAILYTIGERHSFKTDEVVPMYVISKDIIANTITVSENTLQPNNSKVVTITNLNLMGSTLNTLQKGENFQAKTRYRQEDQDCVIGAINKSGDQIVSIELKFTANQDSITPGQSVVLYRGEECLIGGIIS